MTTGILHREIRGELKEEYDGRETQVGCARWSNRTVCIVFIEK